MLNNEDMNQVLGQVKSDMMRDLRVASLAVVINAHKPQVDVQLTVRDEVDGAYIDPPVVKNLYVIGNKMPDAGDIGVVLHLDRANNPSNTMQQSGGPAHDVGYGVFLPILT